MTNVHEHNDVLVSIKVQEFRSRYAKYVYYKCSSVLCECHGDKRDCEPSRVPVNFLKRLSQKSRKLELYMGPIEEKRTKIIESSSSYQKCCRTKEK